LTLGSVIGLTFFAEPQHHYETAGRHRVAERPLPGVHARGLGQTRTGVPKPLNGHALNGVNGVPVNGHALNGVPVNGNGAHGLNGGHQPAPRQRPPAWPPAPS
jgi:hypothetical protein